MPHGGYHRLFPTRGMSPEERKALEIALLEEKGVVASGAYNVNTPLSGQIDPALAQTTQTLSNQPAIYHGPSYPTTPPPVLQSSSGTIPKPVLGAAPAPQQASAAGPKPPPPRRPKPTAVAQEKPPWQAPVPSGKSAAGGESVWQNPDFWLAAATAAGPVLGSLLQPRRFGPAPRAGAPVAGGAGQGKIQGVMGGPVPIDPRVMRPFG